MLDRVAENTETNWRIHIVPAVQIGQRVTIFYSTALLFHVIPNEVRDLSEVLEHSY